jgi:hypothetical protein
MLIIQLISKTNSPPKDSPIILFKIPTILLVPIYPANKLPNRTVIFQTSSIAMPREGPILRRPAAMLGLSWHLGPAGPSNWKPPALFISLETQI